LQLLTAILDRCAAPDKGSRLKGEMSALVKAG
jgi:hypothetical protein